MKLINEIKDTISKNFDPEKIILFGSYAYGRPSEKSDIDLLIIKELPENKIRENRFYIRALLRNIILNYKKDIDILLYRKKDIEKRINLGDLFIKDIYENGNIIYAK